jgi:hypothetical protein
MLIELDGPVADGVGIRRIEDILGHSLPERTARYAEPKWFIQCSFSASFSSLQQKGWLRVELAPWMGPITTCIRCGPDKYRWLASSILHVQHFCVDKQAL